jgi:hypothetical protein
MNDIQKPTHNGLKMSILQLLYLQPPEANLAQQCLQIHFLPINNSNQFVHP